jgi:hypothetical protein
MDGTSVLILIGVAVVVLGVLWGSRGRSGRDGSGPGPVIGPDAIRGEGGNAGGGNSSGGS